MSYGDILHRLDGLRDLIHDRGPDLSHDQRRHLLHRMELLADRLSYDQSGYERGNPTPVLPPRHDRLTAEPERLLPPTG